MSLTEDLLPPGWEDGFQGVPVPAEPDPQVIYDRLVTLVMRQGNWLSSPQAKLLTPAEWERQFARYQEQLEELRRLGDELRASRSTGVRLAGRGGPPPDDAELWRVLNQQSNYTKAEIHAMLAEDAETTP